MSEYSLRVRPVDHRLLVRRVRYSATGDVNHSFTATPGLWHASKYAIICSNIASSPGSFRGPVDEARPIQQSESMRAKVMAEIFIYDLAMLIWIDDGGSDI